MPEKKTLEQAGAGQTRWESGRHTGQSSCVRTGCCPPTNRGGTSKLVLRSASAASTRFIHAGKRVRDLPITLDKLLELP